MAPSVNHEEEEQDEAKTQENDHAGLAFTQLPEASGEFSEIHAGVNLHQFGDKLKRSLAIVPASAPPIEGPLFYGIEVPNKQDQHE
jgi:hypothetical protein